MDEEWIQIILRFGHDSSVSGWSSGRPSYRDSGCLSHRQEEKREETASILCLL